MSNHIEFLLMVEEYVAKHPEVTPHVSDGVARGLNRAMDAARKRQSGLEIALSLAIDRSKRPGVEKLILHAIQALDGHAHLDWSEEIAKLKKAAEAGSV